MVTISGSVLLSCPRCWGMKMRTILSGKNILNRITSSSQPFRSSAGGNKSTEKSGGGSDDGSSYSLSLYDEQYKALNNLDFMTAAKILFTDPPKMKKFGLDFHLVQFFFVCLPSLELKKQAESDQTRHIPHGSKGKVSEESAAPSSEKKTNGMAPVTQALHYDKKTA